MRDRRRHPQWSVAYPGPVLSLEVRRDLPVEGWRPFEEMVALAEPCERVAKVLVGVLA